MFSGQGMGKVLAGGTCRGIPTPSSGPLLLARSTGGWYRGSARPQGIVGTSHQGPGWLFSGRGGRGTHICYHLNLSMGSRYMSCLVLASSSVPALLPVWTLHPQDLEASLCTGPGTPGHY